MIKLVNESQLDNWVRANPQEAQGLIVELVWRLVSACCPNPIDRRFPLADSIAQHGPDGILEVDVGQEPFVPKGRSIWEIGTGLNAGAKATSDLREQTEATPSHERHNSTFLFVTPLSGRRDWPHTWKPNAQASWLRRHKKKRDWKDVRVLDGTKLIDWLHQFTAVEIWLAEKIGGLPPDQIELPESRWALIESYGTPPPLIPKIFLTNREEASNAVSALIERRTVRLMLSTRYPHDVLDFVCAFLASLDDQQRIDAFARTLIVSGLNAWNLLCGVRESLVLIADPALDLTGDAGSRLIQKALTAGHSVISSGIEGGMPDPSILRLVRPKPFETQKALEEAGYSEERSRLIASRCSGHLGSLLRLVQSLSGRPEWAERSDAADLAIAEILGSWTEPSEADRDIIENLAGKAFGEWIGRMRDVALLPGTPLVHTDGTWKLILRYEGWYALGSRIFDDHVSRLGEAIVSVLGETDPQFELPKEQRYAAAIHGKMQKHSGRLRTGLAESLALLGSHPEALTSCTVGKAETTATSTVRALLDGADWLRWASLNDVLPLIAEGAPNAFLDAVEDSLQREPCPFDEVFAQEGTDFVGRIHVTGLLWGLETLAWDPDWLGRALFCLAGLAARDPGGRYANRPTNSLTTILLPWFPQTCASVAQRVAAVRQLLIEQPEVGWKLVLSLLPNVHTHSSGTRKPAWRDSIPDDWKSGSTRRDAWSQYAQYAEMAVTAAAGSSARLLQLIDQPENLPDPAFEKLVEYLGSEQVVRMTEVDREPIWTALVNAITKHNKFADAGWALNAERLDVLSRIAEVLRPTTPRLHHRRLFIEQDFELYDERGDYQGQHERLLLRRQEAIKEILDASGLDGILRFAVEVDSPRRVGLAFGIIAAEEQESAVLPSLLGSENKALAHFSAGFVRGRFQVEQWEWVDGINKSLWTANEIGEFLSILPFTKAAWERSRLLLDGDESPYWTKTTANPYEADDGLRIAVDQLLHFRRPQAAIRCLHRMQHDNLELDTSQVVRALLDSLRSSDPSHSTSAHEIVQLIKALQDDPSVSPDDLFRVEWAYLPLLDEHNEASPKFLARKLATEPQFFCEIMGIAYRSKNEERPQAEVNEEKSRIAANAFRLLHKWTNPPGLLQDGSLDADALNSWLETVKTRCSESGRMEVAMITVGHVLVYAPPDPDGLWIHRGVAAVLNHKDSQDMRDGFSTEIYNSRGVHWVDPSGKPEEELAAKYRDQGEAVEKAGYHRFATTLRQVAFSYEREAKQVRSEAEADE